MVKLDIHAAELVARRLNQTRDLAHYVGVGAKVWPLWFGRPPRPVTKEQEENLKKYLHPIAVRQIKFILFNKLRIFLGSITKIPNEYRRFRISS